MTDGILVYDIGTTSVKSAIFDTEGTPIGLISVPYGTAYPRPGWAQQNPDDYWEAAVTGTRALMAASGSKDVDIAAIGLAGHMNGCLPTDARGNPTHPALIHSDTRGTRECSRVIAAFGRREMYRRTGSQVDAHLSLPKMLWLKAHRSEAFADTAWFLNAKDYLRFKLTGVLGSTDCSDASLTGVFHMDLRQWDTELIDALGLSRHRFPEIRKSTERGGTLSSAAAGLLGLRQGIPVSMGGGDAACATRGAGITDPSQAYASVGSSAWVSMLSRSPVIDEDMRMQNFLDLDGRSCNVCGTVQSAASAVDWVLHLLAYQDEEHLSSDAYREIEEQLRDVPIGSDGVVFLPYLMGERTPHWDASARGVFLGLSLSTDRPTLLRAAYEGVAFALKDVADIYAQLAMPIKSFTLLGGGMCSAFWQGIIADALGMPMHIHPHPSHATSLGAAMAAGVSVGLWSSINEAVQKTRRDGIMVVPDAERTKSYERMHAVYRDVYHRLKPVFNELACMREKVL